MGIESLDSFLTEYDAASGEDGFDGNAFAQDYNKGATRNRVQPITSADVEPGILKSGAQALGGGIADTFEMFARAVRTVDPKGGNDVIRDFATGGLDAIKNFTSKHPSLTPGPEVAEGMKRWYVEGLRSFVPSVASALPGIVAGFALGGGPIGAAIGSTSGGLVFGLAEHDRFKEEVETFITDNKLSGEDAVSLREKAALPAIYSAVTEGGLEAAANALEVLTSGLFRPVRRTIKNVASQPIRQLLKRPVGEIAKGLAKTLPKTAAIEVGTEMSQEALETKFRRDIGLTNMSSWEAAMSVIGPSLVTTLLFMGAAGGANSLHRQAIKSALEKAKTDPNKRASAIREIADIIEATGQPDSKALADGMRASGDRFVKEGLPIDLNSDVGIQNYFGEVAIALRHGDLTLDASKKKVEGLAEDLRTKELEPSERIKATQMVQGLTAVNNAFEGQQIAPARPRTTTRPATTSEKLKDLAEAATTKGKVPVVRDTVEEPIEDQETSDALVELAKKVDEVKSDIQEDVAVRDTPSELQGIPEETVVRKIKEGQSLTPDEELVAQDLKQSIAGKDQFELTDTEKQFLETSFPDIETATDEQIDQLAEEEIVPTEEAIAEAGQEDTEASIKEEINILEGALKTANEFGGSEDARSQIPAQIKDAKERLISLRAQEDTSFEFGDNAEADQEGIPTGGDINVRPLIEEPTQPNKFFIQKPDNTFEEVQGRKVLDDLGDFFVHKEDDGHFVVTEGRSGAQVHAGHIKTTRTNVVNEARTAIESADKGKLDDLIQNAMADSGISPRFGGESKTPKKKEVIGIGKKPRKWISDEGERQIVGSLDHNGVPSFLVSTEGQSSQEIIPESDIEKEIALDERRAEEKDKRIISSQKDQDEAEIANQKEQDIEGFASDKTPMQRGRILKTLNTKVFRDGKVITKKDLVKKLIQEEGYTIGTKQGKDALISPNGSFLQVTKTEIDFALFLKEKPSTIEQEVADITDQGIEDLLDAAEGKAGLKKTDTSKGAIEGESEIVHSEPTSDEFFDKTLRDLRVTLLKEDIKVGITGENLSNHIRAENEQTKDLLIKELDDFRKKPNEIPNLLALGNKIGSISEAAVKIVDNEMNPTEAKVPETRTAKDIIAETAKAGVTGIDESLKALHALFGGAKIKSFPAGFDQDSYNEAKPHFQKAFNEFKVAGQGLKEFAEHMFKILGDAARPFLRQFIKDQRSTGKQTGPKAVEIGPTPENSDRLANEIRRKLEKGESFTKVELFQIADSPFGFRGTRGDGIYNSKDAFDAMELGINRFLSNKPLLNPQTGPMTLERAIANEEYLTAEVTNKIASQQGLRSEEQDEFQQFSTPPEIAHAMAYLANLQRGDVVLEPSAGTGGIATFASQVPGVKIAMNELSPRRAELLKKLDIGRVFQENAEQIDNILPENIKPTVILTNPPFSSTAGRIQGERKAGNVLIHLEQDLARLESKGRMVALIGEGHFGQSDKVQRWLNGLKNKGHSLTASIFIDGKKYKKYGTTFGVRLLVIDKDVEQIVDPADIRIGPDEAIISQLMEVIRNDRASTLRDVGEGFEQNPIESGSEDAFTESGTKGLGVPKPNIPVRVPTDVVGIKEWDDTIGAKPVVGGHAGLVVPVKPEEGTQIPVGERGPIRDVTISRPEKGGESSTGSRDVAGSTGGQTTRGLGDTENRIPERSGEIEETIVPEEETVIEVSSEAVKKGHNELTDKIFEDYTPQKLKIKGAQPHPTALVQSAAMAAVEPPNPTYEPSLPKKLITTGALSLPQLEPIVYGGQAHEQHLANGQRKGFFVGDGPGVGKGRIIAGMIMDNMAKGRKKAMWISANSDLVKDAIRDWTAIGGSRKLVKNLSKVKIANDIDIDEGIVFTTFSTLASSLAIDAGGEFTVTKEGKRSRMDQILKWLGENFDGIVAYDEAHQAANSLPQEGKMGKKKAALRGMAAVDFQGKIPDARIAYASATGATEVAHFAYAERLGLWGEGTAFPNKQNFISEIRSSGVAGMEVIARDMKAQGVYLARSLSYDGVTYDRLTQDLTKDQTKIYDTVANAWQVIFDNLGQALDATGSTGKGSGQAKRNALSKFWGSQLRFFNQVVLSMQMPVVIASMEEELAKGNSPIIQLVNTNESQLERQLAKAAAEGTEEEQIDLTPRQNMIQYLENAFPTQQREKFTDENGNESSRLVFDSAGNPVLNRQAVALKEKMLQEVGSLKIPEGPLEQIINHFGHDKVAEVTGRKRRQVRVGDRQITQKRSKAIANKEVDAYLNDELQILVFSDAGGTGRSYHADRGVKNQRRRIHYVIQPGFKADAAVQGMGRSHRTNQASAPHYYLVTTNVEGQKRFLSKIASRLDQLGALTKGQRQTGSQGLFTAKDNLESQYSRDALTSFFMDLYNETVTGTNFHEVTKALGFVDSMSGNNSLIGESGELLLNNLPPINRFLNRILALPVGFQSQVFTEFHNRMSRIIDRAIANGTFETGMQNIKAFSVSIAESQTVYKNEGVETKYILFEAKHKIHFNTWEHIIDKMVSQGKGKFWMNKASGHVWAVFKYGTRTLKTGEVIDEVLMESPTSHNYKVEDARTLNGNNWIKSSGTLGNPKFARENKEDVIGETWWNEQIKNNKGFRSEKVHLISGALLPIWDRLPKSDETLIPMKVIRIQTDEGERFIGRQISASNIQSTLANLGASVNAQQYEIPDVVTQIIDSKAVAKLSNGWRLLRVRVGGEDRIELKGEEVYAASQELQRNGVFVERIQYETRFFVPTGEKAQQVIENITKNRPIVDVLMPQSPSQESYNTARENLRNKGGNISMGVDPTVIKDMAIVGTYHLKKGIKTFVEWSKAMLKDVGERFKQYLRQVWRNVRVQKSTIDNETMLENEAVSLAKENIPDKEMQVSSIKAIADVKKSQPETEEEVDLINKFITHNGYNSLHNKTEQDRIKSLFPGTKNEDIGFWTRMTSLPWWKAKKFIEWAKAVGVETKRGEDKNLLKIKLGGNVFDKTGENKQHELNTLDDKSADRVTLLWYEGDARNIEFTNKELIEGVSLDELGVHDSKLKGKKIALNTEEIQAYRAVQVSMRRSRKEVIDVLEELLYKPYEGKVWADDLKKMVREKEDARFRYNSDLGLVEDNEEVDAANEFSEDDIPANLNAEDRKEFIEAFQRALQPQITIANYRRRIGKIKGYAPRNRPEGTFKVRVFNNEGRETWANVAKNQREGEKMVRERIAEEKEKGNVLDQDFTIEVKDIQKTPEFLYQQVTTIAIERFMTKALKRLESKEKVSQEELDSIRESMVEALSDELKERGFGRHMMKRRRGQAIGGYQITGGKKIFNGYIGGISGFITKQRAAYQYGQLLSNIDVGTKPHLYEEITIYSRNMLRNQTRADLVSSRIRTAAFVWYLTSQIKAPVVNFTQNWILGIPTLGKFTTGARRKYNKALYDIARGKSHLSDLEIGALKEATERGITGDQLMKEIIGETKTQAGKAYSTVIDILGWTFSQSEIYNRKSAFLARFRAGIEKGETRQQAFDGAREFVFDVHFLYGKENQALIATGGTPFNNIIRTSITFRNFTFNYMNAIKHHLGDGDLVMVGRSLAYMALLGGLSSIPFLDDWLDMLERLTGIKFRDQIQKELKGLGGNVLAEVGTFGLPALIGADLSGSLRIKFPDVTDPSQLFQDSAFGVYGGLATRGLQTVKSVINGDGLRALESASPAFIANPLKALRFNREGVITQTGKTVFSGSGQPLQVSLRESLTQALGFRPSRLAFESGKFRQFTNIESYYRNRRASLFRKLRFAKDKGDRKNVLQAIREYNNEARKLSGAVPLITSKSLKTTQKEQPSKRFRQFSRI